MPALVMAAVVAMQYTADDTLPASGPGYDIDAGASTHRLDTIAKKKIRELAWRWHRMGKPDLQLTSLWRSPDHPIEAAKAVPGDHATGMATDISARIGFDLINQAIEVAREIDRNATVIWQAPGHYDHAHITWTSAPFKSKRPKPKPKVDRVAELEATVRRTLVDEFGRPIAEMASDLAEFATFSAFLSLSHSPGRRSGLHRGAAAHAGAQAGVAGSSGGAGSAFGGVGLFDRLGRLTPDE